MIIDHNIRDEKLQYNINREAAKYQYYRYLAGDETLPSHQSRIIGQAKLT